MKKAIKSLLRLAFIVGLGHGEAAWAQVACTSAQTGNWNAASTWNAPCNVVGGPTSAHAVTITDDVVTVTTAATAASIRVDGLNSGVIISGTNTLDVGGSVTVTASATNNTTNFVNVGAGTLNAASITLNSGNGNRDVRMSVAAGTITTTGSIGFTGNVGNNLFQSTGASTVKVGGNFGAGTTLTTTAGPVGTGTTFHFNGSTAQTIAPYAAHNNIIMENTAGGVSFTGTTTIGGTLTVASGSLNVTGITFIVNGATTVNGNGSLNFINSSANTKTFTGNVIIDEGGVWNNAVNENITLAGNLINNGTFQSGTGLYTFNGPAAQTISRTLSPTVPGPTVFNGSVSAANGINLAGSADMTVMNTLTLNAGRFTTNANTLYIASGNAIAGAGGAIFVDGNLRKRISSTATTRFEVGTTTGANKYAPVDITFAAITTAGDVTVKSTYGNHPQIAGSGIDTAAHVNRYWTITNHGVTFSTYAANFNFVAGALNAGDVDAGANAYAFVAARYSPAAPAAGSWNPTSPGNSAATFTRITGETGFGDFVAGEQSGYNATVGFFNAYDPPPVTPAGSAHGTIRTKLAGMPFTLTIVSLNAFATPPTPAAFGAGTVTVDLIDATMPTGQPTTADNCWPAWTTAPAIATATATFGNNATAAPASFTVNNAYPNVRVRMSRNFGFFRPTACSSDAFAIRPTGLTATSTMNNTGTSGSPRAVAGADQFELTAATGLTGYTGTPKIDNAGVQAHAGAIRNGTVNGVFPASVSGATPANTAFTYSEVGNFKFLGSAATLGSTAPRGVYDDTFTAVDQPWGCTADFSNVLVSSGADNGKYGCKFGLTADSNAFGRFYPKDFLLTPVSLANRRLSSCSPASNFTYAGEELQAGVTLTARNGASTPAITQNYDPAAGFAAFDGSTIANFSFGAIDLADATPPTAAAALTGNLGLVSTSGQWQSGEGSFTVNLRLNRAASPAGPYESFNLGIDPVDPDGVRLASYNLDTTVPADGNDRGLVGVTRIRYGRMKISNAYGSGLLDLPLNVAAQYWSGTFFITNTGDDCTSLDSGNFAQAPHQGGVINTTIQGGGTMAGGTGRITLTKPAGFTSKGSVSIGIAPGSALEPYLPGSPGVATFGIYKGGPIIYMRELY